MAQITLQNLMQQNATALSGVNSAVKKIVSPATKTPFYPTPTGAPIGVQTKSPTDNIVKPPNTTTQPKTVKPSSNSSTENGTNASGATVKAPDDASNKYNTSTGQPNPKYADSSTLPGLANANTPTTGTPYTPPDQGTNGVNQGGIIGNLINTANNETPEMTQARNEIDALKNEYAKKGVNIQQTAGFLTQANGEQGLLQGQYLTALDAANTKLDQATKVRDQAITATTNAGNLNAPTGNIINVSPVTGLPIAGGSLNDLAKTAGTVAGTQAGAATAAAAGGNIQASQATTVAQYKSALQQGQNLQSQLKDLITTFGLNPNDLNVANTGLQKIAANTSDPHYQQLLNYINDIANTYAQILTPPGGTSTDTSRGIASSMLNATASGTSIIDTMKSLDNAANAKIAGVPTTNGGTSTPGGSNFSGAAWN